MSKEWPLFVEFLSPPVHRLWRLLRRDGPATRAELRYALDRLIRRGERFGLILFGIDRFRLTNHRYGFAVADRVIDQLGRTASRFLGHRGHLGRWASDEFLALLPGADAAATLRMAEALRDRIAHLIIPTGDGVTSVTCSFGLACFPDFPERHTLLTAADEALYEAKRAGRNRIVPAARIASPVHRMATLVEAAVREERIVPAYQPIVELASGRPVAEEALARLLSAAEDTTLEAHEFIEAAGQLGLTHKIDGAVIATVIAHIKARRRTGLPIFVNVSGSLLRHPEILHEIRQASGMQDLSAGRLVFEITERELLGDVTTARALLAPFVERGVALALDDFGSGYSSFEYLADLPVSYLKIDGRLIQRLNESRVRAIVRGIQRTAEELGLVTLAECVESERQVAILREIGVHWAQGHHFSRARVDEHEADVRRRLSVNWTQGYYYHRPRA
jgi:diguanylate cyclase (GGDEF)-like protein